MTELSRAPLPKHAFIDWLRREGARRYHDHHPVHIRMHEGRLTKEQLQAWVLNRFYYQTRTVREVAASLAATHDAPADRIETEAIAILSAPAERALVRLAP